TFIRQIAYDLGVKKKLKIGMLMLEENIKRTIKGLMSVASGKRLYINRQGLSDKEYKRCFDAVMGNGNYILYEHFGSLSGDNLMDKIRYMTLAEQCDFIILDHISIAISGLEGDNERKLIDILMTQMRSLVEETGVGMLVISHLRRLSNESTSHEEGGATSLSQLRGSGAIAQLADTVIGLERNQQAQGMQRNMVRIRVLKNRYTGETGIAGYLKYSKETDRLTEVKENENPMLDVQEQNNF
ncbi:MAG: DnaB-like helicase C-terminal domain-containing protein, partial [Dialister micraerophilus]|uniref:DnaB-like helicase C-terminal domain-containing protein n=1 Tax=Dialister micraerophilus TaxID=309120 RepID=UPI002549D668